MHSGLFQRKFARNKKLIYCIVAGKIAQIFYAILRDGVPFNAHLGLHAVLAYTHDSEHKFTVADRKISRRARNILMRIKDIHNVEMLGIHAHILAQELDKIII